jgi:hypothetical protein
MKRRQFITTLLSGMAAAWPLEARAQVEPKMLRVGFVGMQPREAPHYSNFLRRMAELGYQEGRNFTFEYIQAPNGEAYERDYREVAARNVDVFLAVGNERALRAAWNPPEEMIVRQPYLPRFMAGGETNPLGARASWQDGLSHP